MKIAEFNLENGLTVRDMNDDELAQYEKDQEEMRERQIKKEQEVAAKAAAEAKLATLGLTAEDLKALGL